MPGLLKIGMTTGCVETRASQLNSTGVPAKFKIEAKYLCPDCADFERQVHLSFSELRWDDRKEFFRIDIDECLERVKSWHASYLTMWLDEFAEQYTLVESEAFVDPSNVYFLADWCKEDVALIAMAIGEITAEELAPAIARVKKRKLKWNAA
jgi:hypothetical protein